MKDQELKPEQRIAVKARLKPIIKFAILNPENCQSLQGERLKNLKAVRTFILQTEKNVGDGKSPERLRYDYREIVDEIFWDLFLERQITIGGDLEGDDLITNVRPHSEAKREG